MAALLHVIPVLDAVGILLFSGSRWRNIHAFSMVSKKHSFILVGTLDISFSFNQNYKLF
jgi:hypothetical protein